MGSGEGGARSGPATPKMRPWPRRAGRVARVHLHLYGFISSEPLAPADFAHNFCSIDAA
jgi:hypothetical protein